MIIEPSDPLIDEQGGDPTPLSKQEVEEFCNALTGLSGKAVMEVRDRLQLLALPDGYDRLVVREHLAYSKVGEIPAKKFRGRANAFDIVRLMMMTPFITKDDWSSTRPLFEDVEHISRISGEEPDLPNDLVVVVQCDIFPTFAPATTPFHPDPSECQDPAVLIP
ncbi:hypothetical protein [Qipengyuania spongiae]|uniref:Uncharacterized protein n=1 Tax=Qipengyuania spongiae TaxID=2909673 RepID=A0ABY5SWZ7_9SPHN|nr:hypothetical protein [Qipengyuania spongiae]UVI38381.1 hypothetical protein L1F33_08910 [Qipengyuania spongiae]